MLVKIKKLVPNAVIPTYAKPGDAGMDLIAVSVNDSINYIEYGTGLAIEIPEGYVGLIFPRSSNSKKDLLLCNSVGVIDSGYRGEIKLRYKKIMNPSEEKTNILQNIFTNSSTLIYEIERYDVGDKVGQIMILPIPFVEFTEVSELSQTDRGDGGFGSTGK
jgi:dUTP pyrophosphatase